MGFCASARIMRARPADLGKIIVAETEKWGNVIRAANTEAEQCGVVAAAISRRPSTNIDPRSSANAQHRFESAHAQVRVFQILYSTASARRLMQQNLP
jgi:3-deoxy-D-manno-octulosonic-acid transferase